MTEYRISTVFGRIVFLREGQHDSSQARGCPYGTRWQTFRNRGFWVNA
jgi:hypothetical protein